jgi:hypothetical protein
MITAMISSIGSGLIVARTGKYKMIALIGSIVAILGSLILLSLNVHSTQRDVTLIMLVLGLGMGTSMSLYTLIVQNALPTRIGETSAGLTFFRQIGATIGLAAMGSVLNSSYATAFKNAVPAPLKALPDSVLGFFTKSPQVLLSSQTQAALRQQFGQQGPQGLAILGTLMNAVKVGLANSLHNIFFFSLGLSIIGFVILFFLKEIPLSGGRAGANQSSSNENAGESPAEAEMALPV